MSTDLYRAALRAFHDRSDYERGSITNPFGRDGSEGERGLARMRALLAELGEPHTAYPVIHVAGSKGKGSICAFLSTILRSADLRTGRYISPHLHTIRERAAIDGVAMSEDDFSRSFFRVLAAAEAVELAQPEIGRVSAFEISTAMAFEHFAHLECDIAVIEVGLGGTWDATNVVDPALSVIALIDYEHTDILGNTLAEIAENKAGIIKPNRPVIAMDQEPEALQMIRDAAARNHATLCEEASWSVTGTWRDAVYRFEGDEIGPVQLGLAGRHQMRNAGMAVVAALLLYKNLTPALLSQIQRARIDRRAIERGLRETEWPARFEVIANDGEALIVLDGAHTGAAANALVETLDDEYPGRQVEFIFGMLGAKEIERMLRQLRRRSERIALVAPKNPRAMTLEAMATAATAVGLTALPETDLETALRNARVRAGAEGIIVITGSLSFAAEAREVLGLGKTEPLVS